MATSPFAPLRAAFGGKYAEMDDDELLHTVSQDTGVSPAEIAKMYGVRTGESRGALSAGLSSGTDDLKGLGYSAVGAVADAVGADRVRDWANRKSDINQTMSQVNGRPDLERIEDVSGDPSRWLPYAGYQLTKQVPQLAASAVATAVTPEVAVPGLVTRGLSYLPKAAASASPLIGKGVVGSMAVNYGTGVGSLYQEAREGGNLENGGVASLVGAVPYAAAETVPETMLLSRFAHGTGFTGGLGTRVAKAALSQGAAGATSETLQNEMEMAYNGSLSSADQASRRLNSAAAGGLIEGLLGGAGGIRKARQLQDGQPIDLTGGNTTPPTQPLNSPAPGTIDFAPTPADPFQGPNKPYQGEYPHVLDYTPTPVPTSEPRAPSANLAIPTGVPGTQGDLFDPLREGPNEYRPAAPTPTPAPMPDTQTGDLFQQNPSAMTRTMFNPATPPVNEQTGLSQTAGGTRGAVAGNIRSRIMQQVGNAGDPTMATLLAYKIHDTAGDPDAMDAVLAEQRAAQEKALEKLDKKVSGGSNMLTPEEYEKQKAAIEAKLLTVMAAQELGKEHRTVFTNNLAQEGQNKASPGKVQQAPTRTNATEQEQRAGNLQKQLDEQLPVVDSAAQERQQGETDKARMEIVRKVMGEKTRHNPQARVRQALKDAGYTNTELTAAEQAEVERLSQKRADVRTATKQSPGLAYKQGKFTQRSELDTNGQTPEPAPAAEPAPAPAAPTAPETDKTRPKTVEKAEPAAPSAPSDTPARPPAGDDAVAEPQYTAKQKSDLRKLKNMAEKYDQLLACLRRPG